MLERVAAHRVARDGCEDVRVVGTERGRSSQDATGDDFY